MAKNSCHLNPNAPPSGGWKQAGGHPNDVPSLELFEKTVFFRYTRLSRLRFREFFSHLQEGSTLESENLNLF